MPKVNEEYFEKKREDILDAAYAVCMRKPLYEVSMRDIIAESGLSQGGIYRYFPNLTAILTALINRDSGKYDIIGMTDAAIQADDIPEKVIGKLFNIWRQTVVDNLKGVGKIFYESQIAYANNKEAFEHFSKSEMEVKEAYLKEKLFSYAEQKISDGYFKPKLPFENIVAFLLTSMDGMVRDVILVEHYPIEFPVLFEKEQIVASLCAAFVLLLGGNEKIIYSES